MAASEIDEKILNKASEMESVVNRWLVDYYLSLAVETFKNDRYSEFGEIRDILDGILSRPLESTDVMPTKIKVLQFLSRIHDGNKLELAFESDESVTPLESAMGVLDSISQVCDVPQPVLERIHTSIREMLVVVCIQNKEFDKAKDVLTKQFPKPMVGKKAIFMGLVTKKSTTHAALEEVTYQQFKEEMVQFCESLYSPSVPFLHKAAKQLISKRLVMKHGDGSAEPQPDAQDEPAPSAVPQETAILPTPSCNLPNIPRKRLEAAYTALAKDFGLQESLTQLEEEVEREAGKEGLPPADPDSVPLRLTVSPIEGSDAEPDRDVLSQRDSGSPMEAFTADKNPLTDRALPAEADRPVATRRSRQRYTVAQLVMEPDSQASSRDSSASQDQAPKAGPEELAEQTAASSPEVPPRPVMHSKTSTQKGGKQEASETHSRKKLSAVSEEDPLSPVVASTTPIRKLRKRQTSRRLSETLTDSDEINIVDSSLDSSPSEPAHSAPKMTSIIKDGSSSCKGSKDTKWKLLFNHAKETRDTWSDEESLFDENADDNRSIMSSSSKKRVWNYKETQMLKAGVARFGEGNWAKIKSSYPFEERTSVNLKDRWRTMKKLKMV